MSPGGPPPWRAQYRPLTARLSASVPPLVKMTSLGRAPNTSASCSRDSSTTRRARRVVEESREQLAEVFGARPSEVIFTSGGTEADNLAVKGLYWARQDGARRRVLTTSVEHHAILDSVRWLEEAQGAEALWLVVSDDGGVRP